MTVTFLYNQDKGFIISFLTHQPAVISAVIEEQLLVRVDLCGGTEEEFPIGRVSH